MRTTFLTSAALAFALATPAFAGVTYDEALDGDLSNDGFAATDLGVLNLGSNTVTGQMGVDPAGSDPIDPDYFTFEIASGEQLSAVILNLYAPQLGGAQQSFIAIQAGTQVTSDFDTSLFLTSTLIGAGAGSSQGDDVLDDFGAPFLGGSGFTPPLGAGSYAFWWQETADVVDYEFDFIVTEVPAPSSLALLGAGALIAGRRLR